LPAEFASLKISWTDVTAQRLQTHVIAQEERAMKLDVVRAWNRNEWGVTLNGAYIIGFAGPDARDRAVRHCEQLTELLRHHAEMDPREAATRPLARSGDTEPRR
jgi:hypothetical protein